MSSHRSALRSIYATEQLTRWLVIMPVRMPEMTGFGPALKPAKTTVTKLSLFPGGQSGLTEPEFLV